MYAKWNTTHSHFDVYCVEFASFYLPLKSCSFDLTPPTFKINPQSAFKCHNTVGNSDEPQNNHNTILRPQTQMMPNMRTLLRLRRTARLASSCLHSRQENLYKHSFSSKNPFPAKKNVNTLKFRTFVDVLIILIVFRAGKVVKISLNRRRRLEF